jgi:23S rRNA (cytosine1962-C5)-methyltransferase
MPDKTIHISRKRARRRHAWVFSNEVRRTEGDPQTRDTVLVRERDELVGSALYNFNSLIRARLYSPENEDFDADFLLRRLRTAQEYRATYLPGESDYRLCYGESDGLPGLVVDRFGDHFVVQFFAAGIDERRDLVVRALVEGFGAKSVVERNDFRLRDLEGLERREATLHGDAAAGMEISENGVRFAVDTTRGQKTGHYFDQRETRRRVRTLSRVRAVLDLFCYSGGLAINAALGGAERVVGVDSSAHACGLAQANAELNGVADRCSFEVADASGFLRDSTAKGGGFDMICLDPPAFIKSKRERENGMRGYRSLNASAMKCLAPGGVLVTCSCSHHLSWQDMLDVLARAAQDSGRDFTVLDRTTQGADHPVLLAMPESEYLRCFFLRVV